MPAELEAAILRAIEKDRAARWQSVKDFALSLLPFASERMAKALADARFSSAPPPCSSRSRRRGRAGVCSFSAQARTNVEGARVWIDGKPAGQAPWSRPSRSRPSAAPTRER